MDFTENVALKENYSFLVADAAGQVDGGERGFYNLDTRFLSTYQWDFGSAQSLMAETPRPDRFVGHYAEIVGPAQSLGVRRTLELSATSFEDRVVVENTSLERREFSCSLTAETDFVDVFEVRGWHGPSGREISLEQNPGGMTWQYRAKDGVDMATELSFEPAPHRVEGTTAHFRFVLEAGATQEIRVRVVAENPLERPMPGIEYGAWRKRFASVLDASDQPRILAKSIDDLRALLLFTEEGPVPAAGIPWYVSAFGRDSLLTAFMVLEAAPEVAEGTIRYLAAHQGAKHDAFRSEAPGKILHEMRFGELSRTDLVPFGPYFGTVDATPLWVMLLHAHWQRTGSLELVRDLAAELAAALTWMRDIGDADDDGFLEFTPGRPGEGLTVQSWKDSVDSMSHADGTLAQGALAVSEVQGYAYAAYLGAAALYRALGEAEQATQWEQRAERLRAAFHERFWLEDMGTYAMALDGDKRPLRVHNSDAGQLLWTGIVPPEVADHLLATLFSEANFSGWGIRTLGEDEARYNPLSYHNGSVWPHDTALIAGGLARYGYRERAALLKDATFALAASQRDLRPPELVGGYPRASASGPWEAGAPPVPYPVACRPQAWDAAALVYLSSLDL